MDRLNGKNAIVTGATSGIGEAVAEALAAEGAYVAVLGRRKDKGKMVVAAIKGKGGKAFYINADVSDGGSVNRAFDACIRQLGGLDILVNSAGISTGNAPIEYVSEADWDKVMDTNAKGTFLCSKLAITAMKSGGSIINIGSVGGVKSYIGGSAYSASKAAIIMLTKTVAIEHGKDNIRANCILPGSTDTQMFEEGIKKGLAKNPGQSVTLEEVVQSISKNIPLGRIAKPEDIANLAVFLASNQASYINGAVIVADGGQSI